MIRRKTAAIVAAASIALVLASCQSTDSPFGQGGYQRVQVIDIQGGRKVSDDVPLSAVIQPEDLMVSPVIDITTLQEIESATDSVVSSSTLQQAERKAEIEAQYAAGEKIGTVTSGIMLPGTKTGIGMGYVPTELSKVGSEFYVKIRDKQIPAKVVKP